MRAVVRTAALPYAAIHQEGGQKDRGGKAKIRKGRHDIAKAGTKRKGPPDEPATPFAFDDTAPELVA